jgi:alpha(1,3/1,4) fucosyltransferase
MKKKKIRINFKYFGGGFNPNDNFFTNSLKKLYDVEISDNPDYLFYGVYAETKAEAKDLSKKGEFIKKLSPRAYIFLRKTYSRFKSVSIKDKFPLPKGNYVKIFWGNEYVRPKMNECDWAFSTYFEDEINNPRYMRLPIMTNDYQLKNLGIPPLKKNIDMNKIKKEKTRFCNFIYSQDVPARNDFFTRLSAQKRVDAPGRCMNNMPPIKSDSAKKSRSSTNWVLNKLDFLRKYKFTIAFENFSRPGWVTEKLTHPMLVNSIPIYVGNKAVNRDFNTKSFINYNDFNNMKDFIDYIIKVDNDDKLYEKILKEPWYNGNKMPPEFYEERVLNRFKEIFG